MVVEQTQRVSDPNGRAVGAKGAAERGADPDPSPNGSAPLPSAPARTRRNPRWIALGVLTVCLGALASFFLYSQLAESHQVVAVRADISRGEKITAADLGVVSVGDTGGVATVPAADLQSLVGRIAAVDLVKGTLLPPDAVTSTLPPARGKGVIGIRVASGRAPVGFLAPGSPIRLVVLPESAAGGDDLPAAGAGADGKESTNVATITATVVNSTRLDDGVLINVELESGQAVDAASYAAQERIVVIRESER